MQTGEGKLYLYVGIDCTSKFAFAELVEKPNTATARAFLGALVAADPYKIKIVLTDNGIQFADLPKNRSKPTAMWRGHPFDRACQAHDIEHRPTKPKHPWTTDVIDKSFLDESALATKDFSEAGGDWDYDPTIMKDGKIEKLNVLAGKSLNGVLFIGDSLMGQYFPRVKQLYRDHPQMVTSVFASRDHCTPIPHLAILSTPEHVSCEDYYKAAFKLAREPQYKKIVFGGDWRDPAQSPALPEIYTELESDLRSLKDMGKDVVLISNPPTSTAFSPQFLVKRVRIAYLLGQPTGNLVEEVAREDTATPKGAPAKMRQISASIGAEFIDPFDYRCPNGECAAMKGGRPLYMSMALIFEPATFGSMSRT